MTKLEQLKQEATDLGITFNANIGLAKLQEKVDAAKASKANSPEVAPKIPAAAPLTEDIALTATEVAQLAGQEIAAKATEQDTKRRLSMRQQARQAEKEARKTQIIEVIDNDPKLNAFTEVATVTSGNAYFSLGTVNIPLAKPTEVMQGHIDTLREVTYVHHVMDRKTGLSNLQLRKRYSITYVQ